MTLLESPHAPPDAPRTPPRRPSGPSLGWLGLLVVAAIVAVAAVELAGIGRDAIYVVLAVGAAALLLWSVRDLIGPPFVEALERLRPRPLDTPPLRRARTVFGVVLSALAAAILGFAVAGAGSKVLYATIALAVLAIGLWILWPACLLLFDTPPERARPSSARGDRTADARWAAVGLGARPSAPGRTGGRPLRVLGVLVAALAAGMVAFFAATMGAKALLVLVGGVVVVSVLLRARDKTLVVVFATVCSLSFLVHKSFGHIDTSIAGGAPSIYITSFDAMVLLLYALWLREGTFVADVRAARSRRILWVPLIGMLLMLPSVLAPGASLNLAAAELVRMGWMYLLFFYVAVRVRTRAMIWAILAGFAAFAAIEVVVVLLQWKTGGVLGLSFLGVPTQLTLRITNTSELGRPFGTIIHPDFMGAAMGVVALLGFAVGLTRSRSLTKVIAFAVGIGGVLCLYIAHTRSSLAALVIALVAIVVVVVKRRQLAWKTIGKVVVVLAVATAIFFPQLEGQIANNFGTSHFSEEVASRYQLNDVAVEMFAENPIIGVGLNNFQNAMGPYEEHGVIFIDNPVQNLYLLYLSETGIVGMAGFLLVGGAMFLVAIRLARSRDRLFAGIGLGVSAAMAFLAIEELLDFALREDVPLALYWIFAGLAVACCQMAGLEGRRRPDAVGDSGPGGGAGHANSALLATERRPSTAPKAPHSQQLGASASSPRAPGATLLRRAGAGPRPSATTRARRSHRVARRGDHRRPLALACCSLAVLLLGALLVVALPAFAEASASASAGAASASDNPVAAMRIVFAAESNGVGGRPDVSGIFVANADGTGLKALIEARPGSNTIYGWPEWALGGTKILYTVRNGPPTSAADPAGRYENLWEMNPNGTGRRQLTDYAFRAVQPKMSPNGQSVIFNAQNPLYPIDAIYELNLLTLQATNLSQRTQPNGAMDADPIYAPNGDILIAATEHGLAGEAVEELAADGSRRTTIISDGEYNTDPSASPNDEEIAVSAFDGRNPTDSPATQTAVSNQSALNPSHWIIQVHDRATGTTTALTKGDACLSLTVTCAPDQSSGWQPNWSPNGKIVAWIGRLDGATTCICAATSDGSEPQVLLQSNTEDITWFDWIAPDASAPRGAVPSDEIGSKASSSRLLISAEDLENRRNEILEGPSDLMGADVLSTPRAPQPSAASWSAAGSTFVFVAKASYNPKDPHYGPPPPPGKHVHVHFTLNELDPALPGAAPDDIPASEQVFLHRSNGTVVQLTTPWTEDWRDAIEPGDLRANTDPVLSPNGRYVVFTNHSSLTGESFLLRMDLRTGAVLNLTNGTSGALAVDDAEPAFSPNGSEIAFTWTDGADTDVYVMNTSSGTTVRRISDSDGFDMDPTWAPNGASIVFSHYRGQLQPSAADLESLIDLPSKGWSLVKVDLATGTQTVLTTPAESPTWRPVYSPGGSAIDYVGLQYRTKGIFQTTPDGAAARAVLIMPDINVTSLAWR